MPQQEAEPGPEAHFALGNALHGQGRFSESEARYRRAIELKPGFHQAHNNLGAVLEALGRMSEAEASYRRAVELHPGYSKAHNNLGNALHALGRLSEAEAGYRRAIELNPDYHEAYNNLGAVLAALGRIAEAEASYRRALILDPDYHMAHGNLANALQALGRFSEAEASYLRAIELRPDLHEAHYNLGNALQALGRSSEAQASYRRAIALKPGFHEAHNNLGNALQTLGRFSEAEASFRRALALRPDYSEAHSNLGNVLHDLGRLAEAEASYRQALKLKPDFHEAYSNLIFSLNYLPGQTAATVRVDAGKYGELVAAKARAYSTWLVTTNRSRRMRIGLVSGDLGSHPVTYFLEGFLSELSREQIELYAYETMARTDAVSERIKLLFAAWRPIIGMSDEQLARRIHADAIDVLVDLSGHTAHNRLPVFAWKPAPVQVTWLGYCESTGVPGMDYILGDPYCTPADEAAHYSETIWRLPETNCCFTPPAIPLQVAPLPALRNGFVTFGSFNNLTKMNHAVVALWARVLAAVPDSRLFLKARQLGDAAVREDTLRRFATCGVAAGRLVLEGHSSRAEMLRDYERVDIALDPFPVQGGTVSVEALWMGVPVLTRRGERFLAHFGEMIASNAGLSDWIASDDDGFVMLAVKHAAGVDRLSRLRAGLRAQVLASPLFDAPRFARHFEDAMRGMWRNWCDRQSPPLIA
ncbi:MAG: tetratricopeptide repeat protein [Betaproteobacteria bacterium]|nr:tetratricopeptide repeat protein [Betaproteobacteria bacterium]